MERPDFLVFLVSSDSQGPPWEPEKNQKKRVRKTVSFTIKTKSEHMTACARSRRGYELSHCCQRRRLPLPRLVSTFMRRKAVSGSAQRSTLPINGIPCQRVYGLVTVIKNRCSIAKLPPMQSYSGVRKELRSRWFAHGRLKIFIGLLMLPPRNIDGNLPKAC